MVFIISYFYVCSYPDKIPKIMQTLRNEGASEFKIKEALQRKELAANERYNNRSTVGYLIQMNIPHKESKSSSMKPQLYEQT